MKHRSILFNAFNCKTRHIDIDGRCRTIAQRDRVDDCVLEEDTKQGRGQWIFTNMHSRISYRKIDKAAQQSQS